MPELLALRVPKPAPNRKQFKILHPAQKSRPYRSRSTDQIRNPESLGRYVPDLSAVIKPTPEYKHHWSICDLAKRGERISTGGGIFDTDNWQVTSRQPGSIRSWDKELINNVLHCKNGTRIQDSGNSKIVGSWLATGRSLTAGAKFWRVVDWQLAVEKHRASAVWRGRGSSCRKRFVLGLQGVRRVYFGFMFWGWDCVWDLAGVHSR